MFRDLIEYKARKFQVSIKCFRSDNGTEFVNNQMNNFLQRNGIIYQTSCAYTPQQNGIAEKKHRHLLNVARFLMFQGEFLSIFEKGYKLYNLETKSFIVSRDVKFYENIFPFKFDSAYKISFSENDLNHLNFFDSAYFQNETSNKKDFKNPNDEGRDTIICDGKSTTLDSSFKNTSKDSSSVLPVTNDTGNSSDLEDVLRTSSSDGTTATQIDDHTIEPSVQQCESNDQSKSEGTSTDVLDFSIRSSRKTVLPSKYKDYYLGCSNNKCKYEIQKFVNYSCLSSENFCFASNLNKTHEPNSYWEVAQDPNWVNAMNEEMEALNRNGTSILTELPKDRKPIGCKWVYRIKYKSTGVIDRYKARLVAKGFNQREGLDLIKLFHM
ncbi:uncharacterized protein [Rutidosis leptorrhynchoides]|uniref:uncharacterized protein n=1 Tax=Rutidosis leptorrhynchoides TaxID=125765 RepID=UPI003A996B01